MVSLLATGDQEDVTGYLPQNLNAIETIIKVSIQSTKAALDFTFDHFIYPFLFL